MRNKIIFFTRKSIEVESDMVVSIRKTVSHLNPVTRIESDQSEKTSENGPIKSFRLIL